MNKSCDGLWRTYSNNKQKLAVQVRTTVGALVKAYVEKDNDALSHLFFGKVVYENTDELKRRGAITEYSSLVEDLDSLFYKRRDFEYEQEVRLVATMSQRSLKMFENASRLKTCQYALFCFNDLNWIDGCVVSPWASFMEIAMVKELAKLGGIDPAYAMKSDLYESWRWKS